MNGSYVFGYGSLVNPATHDYSEIHQATLYGWRRAWRHAEGRDVAFLTVERAPQAKISGALARVPDAKWPELIERERWYLREPTQDVEPGVSGDAFVFHAPPDLHSRAETPLPILLSYLDVVVQGMRRLLVKMAWPDSLKPPMAGTRPFWMIATPRATAGTKAFQ